MSTGKSTKRSLLCSILAICICLAMLIGTTFAWFTDTATANVNTIKSGVLDVVLEMKDAQGEWVSAEGKPLSWVQDAGENGKTLVDGAAILWEPGCTYELQPLRVRNNGNLALKYKVEITGIDGDAELNEAIVWIYSSGDADYALNAERHLAAKASADEFVIKGHMREDAGNEYQNMTIDGIAITVYAAQDTVEFDSISDQYDANAIYPLAMVPKIEAAAMTRASDDAPYIYDDGAVKATLPADGAAGAEAPTITVKPTDKPSGLEISAEGKSSVSYDINVGNKADGSAVELSLFIGTGLTGVQAFHENSAIDSVYNPNTGFVTFSSADFSPFTFAFTSPAALVNGAACDSLQTALTSGGSVVLCKDVTVPEQLTVAAGTTVTLNLNGKKLESTYGGYSIGNNGTLTINDSVGTGIIYNSSKAANESAGYYSHDAVRNFGVLTINGGNFGDQNLDRTDANDTHYGAAIRNQAGATCTINGGNFTCVDNYGKFDNGDNAFSYALRSYGTLIINGGTVYGKMNGGVAADGGAVTINGGSFSLADGKNTAFYVLATSAGSITVNGGTFTRTGTARLLGGFNGMPSWDATNDLATNKYTINGGTFTVNGETVTLPANNGG